MTPTKTPRIPGDRVELRPFTEALISEEYLGWLNDKTLMQYSRQRHLSHTRESCREYLQSFESTPHCFWATYWKAPELHIGTMTAYVDPTSNVADLGILIGHRMARECGVGREAWGLAMGYLFAEEGLRRVTGGTVAWNVPMIRIFEHWGMKREGTLREHELIGGHAVDVVLYGLLANERAPLRVRSSV